MVKRKCAELDETEEMDVDNLRQNIGFTRPTRGEGMDHLLTSGFGEHCWSLQASKQDNIVKKLPEYKPSEARERWAALLDESTPISELGNPTNTGTPESTYVGLDLKSWRKDEEISVSYVNEGSHVMSHTGIKTEFWQLNFGEKAGGGAGGSSMPVPDQQYNEMRGWQLRDEIKHIFFPNEVNGGGRKTTSLYNTVPLENKKEPGHNPAVCTCCNDNISKGTKCTSVVKPKEPYRPRRTHLVVPFSFTGDLYSDEVEQNRENIVGIMNLDLTAILWATGNQKFVPVVEVAVFEYQPKRNNVTFWDSYLDLNGNQLEFTIDNWTTEDVKRWLEIHEVTSKKLINYGLSGKEFRNLFFNNRDNVSFYSECFDMTPAQVTLLVVAVGRAVLHSTMMHNGWKYNASFQKIKHFGVCMVSNHLRITDNLRNFMMSCSQLFVEQFLIPRHKAGPAVNVPGTFLHPIQRCITSRDSTPIAKKQKTAEKNEMEKYRAGVAGTLNRFSLNDPRSFLRTMFPRVYGLGKFQEGQHRELILQCMKGVEQSNTGKPMEIDERAQIDREELTNFLGRMAKFHEAPKAVGVA